MIGSSGSMMSSRRWSSQSGRIGRWRLGRAGVGFIDWFPPDIGGAAAFDVGRVLSVESRLNPVRQVDQALVGEARADQLNAERHAVATGAGRQGDAGRSGQGPDRVALRVAGLA